MAAIHYDLDATELAGLDRIRREVARTPVGLGAIDAESTPVPELAAALGDWLHRREDGVGFALIRGLDLDGWTEREAGIVYYALGRHLGPPGKQNAQGHLLGRVRDTGRDIFTDPNARGYQVRIGLPSHTDTSTDVLGLLCLQQARSGGDSALAPLQTVCKTTGPGW